MPSSNARTRRAPLELVAAAALGALGALGGALAHSLAFRSPVAPALGGAAIASPVRDPALERELLAVLRDLRAALDALRGALVGPASERVRAAAEPAPRAVVAAPGAEPALEAAELAAGLRELATALATARLSPSSSASGGARLSVPAWVDREAAFAALGLGEAMRAAIRSGDEDAFGEACGAARGRHLFWSQQDVLSAYGPPDTIDVEGSSATWRYTERLDDELEVGFGFQFHQGMVIGLDVRY